MSTRSEPLERDIQRAIVRVLRLHRFDVEVLRQGAMRVRDPGKTRTRFVRQGMSAGTPDLYVVHTRAIWLEVKRPSGRLTEAQEELHEAWRRRGVFVAVVRSPVEAVEAVRAAEANATDVGRRWAR